MPVNMANFDAVLKEYTEGVIRKAVNDEVVAFKILDETDREWSGRHVRFPVKLGRNVTGVGARAEATTLPVAANTVYGEARISSTYQYGRIRISGPTLEAGMNAFAEALQAEMDGTLADWIVDQRQGRLAA